MPNPRHAMAMICALFLSWNPVLSAQESNPPADLNHPFMEVDLTPANSPLGIPEIGPLSEQELQRVNLGRRLYFDTALSVDGTTSCATCHRPENGFSSPLTLPKGVGDRIAKRHAPAILNRHLGSIQFWDGRMTTLEQQALQPIETENELANTIDAVLKTLNESPEYRTAFAAAFTDGITKENLAKAIASFERIIITGESPIDRFVTARESVLTKAQRQGLWLYESKGGCWQCHAGQNYSDEEFHNTGVSWGQGDLGRFEHTGEDAHRGQFKTPTLRNVGITAPYMHDGSIKTLREVVEFYNEGGTHNPHLDQKMKPLDLTEQEIDDLVEFLKALNGRYIWETSNNARASADPESESAGE